MVGMTISLSCLRDTDTELDFMQVAELSHFMD